ncbi:DUF2662 domain-containing protein [Rhodococcus rhodnii]|uniref:DUF2662 domain-containing protein n=1 Tax=Rhodococcus rhodnii TaxID=38312 RepID=A0A6P2CFA0_9NOCA|nr:FhaA domain-containing protein [Rhodococcus rhodnii]TXG89598.1 DUF2662 domain-containing protein [Rhodococcus rhodnii]
MGIVARFERKLQGAVGDAFARVFGGGVVPQEVESALRQEASDRVEHLDGGHMLAPNNYVITINNSDHDALAADRDITAKAFSRHLEDYIREQGWQTYGPVQVVLEPSQSLHTGQFRASGSVDPDAGRRDPGRAPSAPPGPRPDSRVLPPPGPAAPSRPQLSTPDMPNAGAGPMTQNSGYDAGREPAAGRNQDPQYVRNGHTRADQDQRYAQSPQNGYDHGAGEYQGGYGQGYGQGYAGEQQGYQQDSYDRGYGQNYQDQGYQPQGYQDQGYRDQGHQDPGYRDQGYQDQGGYADPGYQPGAYRDQGYQQDQGYRPQDYQYDQGGYDDAYQQQGSYDRGYQQDYAYEQGGYAPQGYADGHTFTATLQLEDGSGRHFQLREGSNIVGRGQDAQFRLPDTGVSRRHIDIRWDGRVAMLSDLGSTNGTTVNGAPVQDWQLADGDIIRAGHSEILVRIV